MSSKKKKGINKEANSLNLLSSKKRRKRLDSKKKNVLVAREKANVLDNIPDFIDADNLQNKWAVRDKNERKSPAEREKNSLLNRIANIELQIRKNQKIIGDLQRDFADGSKWTSASQKWKEWNKKVPKADKEIERLEKRLRLLEFRLKLVDPIRITGSDINRLKNKRRIKGNIDSNKKQRVNNKNAANNKKKKLPKNVPNDTLSPSDFTAEIMVRDWVSARAIDIWATNEFKPKKDETWNLADQEVEELKLQMKSANTKKIRLVDEQLLGASNTASGDVMNGGKGKKNNEAYEKAAKAFDFVESLRNSKLPLSVKDIQDVNSLFNQGVKSDAKNKDENRKDYYGVLADSRHLMGGNNTVPPGYSAAALNDAIQKVNDALNGDLEDVNPVAVAAEFYARFISIHPFRDGNGRTARLMVNLILTRFGLPPAVHGAREVGVTADPYRELTGGYGDVPVGGTDKMPQSIKDKMQPYQDVLDDKLKSGKINAKSRFNAKKYPRLDLDVKFNGNEVNDLTTELIYKGQTDPGIKQVQELIKEMKLGLDLMNKN